jgi:ribose 5-phosphate isomerase B
MIELVIGSDHRGYKLKNDISKWLTPIDKEPKFNISIFADNGPYDDKKVDYPKIALNVSRDISSKLMNTGILICGSGFGVSIAANRVPRCRAVVCRTEKEAEMARLHNDANILCLGADSISLAKAKKIITKFFTTKFEGGRHQQRVDMMR